LSVAFGLVSGAVSITTGLGSRPLASAVTVAAARLSLLVLTPLGIAKRRLGKRMGSRALQRDGALSGIGAATSFLAITALSMTRCWASTDCSVDALLHQNGGYAQSNGI
jgi:hypothetical protein